MITILLNVYTNCAPYPDGTCCQTNNSSWSV